MNTIVSVPLILSLGSRDFPIPCTSLPNSLDKEVVHILCSLSLSNKSIDYLTPVAMWYTGHAQSFSIFGVACILCA